MSTAANVVVGIDYSECGDLALEQAFEVAHREHLEPHVVHATLQVGAYMGVRTPDYGETLEQAREQLATYVRRKLEGWLASRGGSGANFKQVFTHVRVGAADEAIAKLASDLDANMVLVGTHGRRGLSRLMTGSIAEGVVRLAPCPVLVVRPKSGGPSSPTGALPTAAE